MPLYLIGLGLADERDITVRGLGIVKRCDEVWLETYTSILGVDKSSLETFYGRSIRTASRETVESEAEQILRGVEDGREVAVLVVGDPLCATTHADLALRAFELSAKVEIVQNASIMGAAGRCGLQLYRFGQTISVPYFDGDWKPTSFYEKILANSNADTHTLCLLDIKTKEPDYHLLAKTGRMTYLPPRFMSVPEAIAQLFHAENEHRRGLCTPETLAVGLARLGQQDELMVAGTLQHLTTIDFKGPLHSLVLCAPNLHEIELKFLERYKTSASLELATSSDDDDDGKKHAQEETT